MKNFIKKHFLLKNLLWLLAIFSIVSIILPFFIEKALLEKFTFIITALAFIAGAMAIILQKMAMKQQEKDGKKAEELLKEQIEKQEIIGAWQLLTTKASGNSGKKEAIEFLASKGTRLSGIDLSTETNIGQVYLQGLFKDFKGDRSKINLFGANFSGAHSTNVKYYGANLSFADLSGANLGYATFNKAIILKTKFNGANLLEVNFSSSCYFNTAEFTDSYIHHEVDYPANGKSAAGSLPIAPAGYKFELDERTDKNGKPIYPKANPLYRFIKLVKLEI